MTKIVHEGDTVKWTMSKKPYVVATRCNGEDGHKWAGEWICEDCGLGGGYEGERHDNHRVFWWCTAHGAEATKQKSPV